MQVTPRVWRFPLHIVVKGNNPRVTCSLQSDEPEMLQELQALKRLLPGELSLTKIKKGASGVDLDDRVEL